MATQLSVADKAALHESTIQTADRLRHIINDPHVQRWFEARDVEAVTAIVQAKPEDLVTAVATLKAFRAFRDALMQIGPSADRSIIQLRKLNQR